MPKSVIINISHLLNYEFIFLYYILYLISILIMIFSDYYTNIINNNETKVINNIRKILKN